MEITTKLDPNDVMALLWTLPRSVLFQSFLPVQSPCNLWPWPPLPSTEVPLRHYLLPLLHVVPPLYPLPSISISISWCAIIAAKSPHNSTSCTYSYPPFLKHHFWPPPTSIYPINTPSPPPHCQHQCCWHHRKCMISHTRSSPSCTIMYRYWNCSMPPCVGLIWGS